MINFNETRRDFIHFHMLDLDLREFMMRRAKFEFMRVFAGNGKKKKKAEQRYFLLFIHTSTNGQSCLNVKLIARDYSRPIKIMG